LASWNRIEAAGNRTVEARRQAPSAPPELRTDVETWLLPLARRRTAAVCDNIKKAKIKLPTVRVIEGNLSLLQSCASASNMFYDVQVARPAPGRLLVDRRLALRRATLEIAMHTNPNPRG